MSSVSILTERFDSTAVILQNEGHLCTILDAGAEIQELVLDVEGEKIPVIVGYPDKERFKLHKGSCSAILLPFPNRLAMGKYTFHGIEYTFPIDEPLYNNCLHGFHRALPYQRQADGSYFWHYSKENDSYPFDFMSVVQYAIEKDGFYYSITVEAGCPLPIALGWHPYFTLPSELEHWKLTLPSGALSIELNENKIPTGKKKETSTSFLIQDCQIDTCFELPSEAKKSIYLEDEHYVLELKWNEPHRFVQIYIPPNRNCIAIEPMTGNINCFQNGEGLTILNTDEKLILSGSVICYKKR